MKALVSEALPDAKIHFALHLDDALAIAAKLDELKIVVLDLHLPDCHGLQALIQFRFHVPDAKVVVFSSDEDNAVIHAALGEGAAGYVPKSTNADLIVSALKLVADGGRYIPTQVLHRFAPPAPGRPLTERQKAVLRLIALGCSNRRIAEELTVSENTVKQHINGVLRALGAASRSEAVAQAVRLGINIH